VYTGYVYIGETLTGARFYEHESANNGGFTSQHVHRVISRLGSSLYDTLAIDFPSSTNRKHVEFALIKHFDRYGKDLLNVLGRSSFSAKQSGERSPALPLAPANRSYG
jgi:hypothetical protein